MVCHGSFFMTKFNKRNAFQVVGNFRYTTDHQGPKEPITVVMQNRRLEVTSIAQYYSTSIPVFRNSICVEQWVDAIAPCANPCIPTKSLRNLNESQNITQHHSLDTYRKLNETTKERKTQPSALEIP